MNLFKRSKKDSSKGFTLIEILLVIGLIAILASIVIVAINPARQFQNARDSERWSDVNAIMGALYQYALDNNGEFPSNITTDQYEICVTGAESCDTLYDLSVLTDNELYLTEMPIDPLCPIDDGQCQENGTGYQLGKTANGRIQITAQGENVSIEITR